MNRELWTVNYELWTVSREPWTVSREPWTVNREPWAVILIKINLVINNLFFECVENWRRLLLIGCFVVLVEERRVEDIYYTQGTAALMYMYNGQSQYDVYNIIIFEY